MRHFNHEPLTADEAERARREADDRLIAMMGDEQNPYL